MACYVNRLLTDAAGNNCFHPKCQSIFLVWLPAECIKKEVKKAQAYLERTIGSGFESAMKTCVLKQLATYDDENVLKLLRSITFANA